MANLIRSAKSGSDWTLNELDSYHISLNQIDPLMFFGVPVGEEVTFAVQLYYSVNPSSKGPRYGFIPPTPDH
ncbi:hypothetical protein BS47DRAFT_1296144 [Hydnum rufescens UP504]|uniref:Uncharacterized protein n=1 Tax=Hydnum rufescens UP504 TaxID=1448309 RepID=A0A9P6AWZ8_9AGAM|nr:hypothetical protein BS47DRAFT_1296144 [Hydnum rufescens UP504]